MAKKKRKECRHCKTRPAWASRGLCKPCYDSPARDLYPLGEAAKFVPQRPADPWKGRPPRVPTDALPGTLEKIEVMAQRAARGESLFHDDDAKPDTEDE